MDGYISRKKTLRIMNNRQSHCALLNTVFYHEINYTAPFVP